MPAAQVIAERGHAGIDGQDDVTAVATVAAVWAAARHVGLTAEGGGAVATGTCGDEDAGVVSEHGLGG
jgi:hypothetical protein